MQNRNTYIRCYFLLILICCIGLRAESQVSRAAGDSLRQSLFFKSHVLISSEQIAPELIDSLVKNPVPIAVRSSGKAFDFATKLAARMSSEVLPLVVISEKATELGDQSNLKLLVLDRQEVQKYDAPGERTSLSLLLLGETVPDSLWQVAWFFEMWEQNGRLPHFISAPNGRILQTAKIVRSLNNQPKIFGVVRDGNQLLTDVLWKDMPGRKTSGYFSFPVRTYGSSALAPYKPGYRFSPDIILPSPENLHNLKVFNALPLESGFGLTDQFSFSNKVRNLYRKNDSEIMLYGLRFVKDTERGKCAFFSGKTFLDGGLKSRLALNPNFSVTAWIKPTELGNNNCILAKGKDFVLKLHSGKLTFTVQGVKDYRSEKTPIPVNQWSFISLVHSSADNHIRFYLNGELTDQVLLLTPYKASDYTMLIGSNLWEEFFKGYISEIKIWERELNNEEIRNEFRSENEPGFTFAIEWLVGIILILVALGFELHRRSLAKKTNQTSFRQSETQLQTTPEVKLPVTFQEQICCFGGLKVINAEGKDLCLKFSPKIKQLFVLILLHSEGEEKGISSQKLSDCLWPGMSVQNAKNIRGTTIQNLKSLLALSGIRLVFQDKLWRFELAGVCFSELGFVEPKLSALEKGTSPEIADGELMKLIAILKRGTLFQGLNELWIDPYIERMSNRIIEFGQRLFLELSEENHDLLLLDVAEVISINDPLNETALRKKISILTRQGKLSMAHSVFDNFTKLYFELYREKYPSDFKSLTGSDKSIL